MRMLRLGSSANSAAAPTLTSIWYVYLVETAGEDGHVKQRSIRNRGRKEEVERRGDRDRLVRSAARLAQRSMILSPLDEDGARQPGCNRIGPPLRFARLWRDTQCGAVLQALLAGVAGRRCWRIATSPVPSNAASSAPSCTG